MLNAHAIPSFLKKSSLSTLTAQCAITRVILYTELVSAARERVTSAGQGEAPVEGRAPAGRAREPSRIPLRAPAAPPVNFFHVNFSAPITSLEGREKKFT